MKKVVIIFLFCLFIDTINASDKDILTNIECIDGDTIKAEINGEIKKIRFLAVDTPETKYSTKDKDEPYAVEASEFTCRKIKEANIIEIEYDSKSDKEDKYGRVLGWIFVDDVLLQKELISNGYAKIRYVYDNYKYVDILKKEEKIAQKNKLNIWSDYEEEQSLLDKIFEFIINEINSLLEKLYIFVKNILNN